MSLDSAPNTAKSSVEFKSSTFSVPVLVIQSHDLSDITRKLEEKLQQAPDFFKNSPILLDVRTISEPSTKKLDLNALIKLLRDKKLFPIGLRGGNADQNNIAIKLGVSIQPTNPNHENEKNLSTEPAVTHKIDSEINSATDQTTRESSSHPEFIPATLINTPIRSGQRIYAPGDLIILSQVSAGAEIMAEGNIHVYNSLRGRALAGVLGNTQSRIFCFDLQAELISIAGNYKVNDDLDKSIQHKPVQIYLQDLALIIKEL